MSWISQNRWMLCLGLLFLTETTITVVEREHRKQGSQNMILGDPKGFQVCIFGSFLFFFLISSHFQLLVVLIQSQALVCLYTCRYAGLGNQYI